MSSDEARIWLIKMSLLFTGATFIFFIIAPALNYPLSYDQTPRIFEVILPVFIGYIGTATHFFFHNPAEQQQSAVVPKGMLSLLIKGPIYVFGCGAVALIAVFGFSNRAAAPGGSGMSIDQFSAFLTSLLGLLAVSTGVAVPYLFSLKKS